MSFPDSNVSSPMLSPSLDELDEAILTDENSNALELVALLPVSEAGHSGLSASLVTPGVTSQVTNRRGKALVNCPGGEKIRALAVCSLDSLGNPKPLSVPKFQSTVQTGTGSQQSIPHGLGVVPSLVLVSVYNNDSLTAFSVVEGSHDATNLYVTATSGISYKVIAFV